jgi:hypothetical protein
MTAALSTSTAGFNGQHGDTPALAMDFQTWILHIAQRSVNCRCVICETIPETQGARDA